MGRLFILPKRRLGTTLGGGGGWVGMKVIVVGGTQSGVGKTSIAVGLMAALRCVHLAILKTDLVYPRNLFFLPSV